MTPFKKLLSNPGRLLRVIDHIRYLVKRNDPVYVWVSLGFHVRTELDRSLLALSNSFLSIDQSAELIT